MPGLRDMMLEETELLICAELEKIIWGKTRPRTRAAVKKIGREIDKLIDTAEVKAEAARQKKSP